MITEDQLQAYRNQAAPLDQHSKWAMGKLLEWIVELDARVDSLEREARRTGGDQAVMYALRRRRLYPGNADVEQSFVGALRASIDHDHRTMKQLTDLTGLSEAELAPLLDG